MTDIDTAALREEWVNAFHSLPLIASRARLADWAEANGPALLDEVDRLRAERDEARATVARVEAHRAAWASRATGEEGRRIHAAFTAALTPDTKETDR